MKTTLLLIVTALTGCVPYQVNYVDPITGIAAGYSSKGGIVIDYRPLHDK